MIAPSLKKTDAQQSVSMIMLLILIAAPVVLPEWLVAEFSIYFSYALFAASLAFVWGHCGLLCLGHAVYFGIGAYAMSFTTLGMIPGLDHLVSTWIGLAAAMIAPAVFAYLLGFFLFSAKGLEGAFFGIVTLAVAFILERLFINWDYAGGLNGLLNVPPLFVSPSLIGFTLSAEVLIWVALGGRGMLVAACAGAILVRLLESNLSSVFGDTWLVFLGAFFVITVMYLPRGLFGEAIHFIQRRIMSRK